MLRRLIVPIAVSWVALPATLAAGGTPPSAVPWTDQSQVNVTTAGYQGSPEVASLAGGGWVVVWADQGGAPHAIRLRRLDRAGTPIAGEQTVATPSSGGGPAIARLADGRLVVIWRDLTPSPGVGNTRGIQGRFLSTSGQPVGSVFTVQAIAGSFSDLDVAPGVDAGFVVAWSDGDDVLVRRLNGSGAPIAAAQIASTLSGGQRAPRLARLEDGCGHVLVWRSATSAGDDDQGMSVQWRLLPPNGTFVEPESQVNSHVDGHQEMPDVVATADGGFAVAWRSSLAALTGGAMGNGIDLRFFAADGAPRGSELTISSDAGPATEDVALARGADGDLVAVWTVDNGVVAARRHAARRDAALGAELRIDDFDAAGGLQYPRVATDDEGEIAVVWESYLESPGGDDSDGSVQVRVWSPGRLARWRLEEGAGTTAGDSAGLFADDAVLGTGDPQWSWGRPGHAALAFDGGGLADVSPSADLALVAGGVTISAWLRLETPPSALPDAFASIYDAAEDNYVLYLDRAAQELRFKVTVANGTSARPGIAEADLPIGRWFHVAGVYRGNGVAEIHLDGELADQHLDPSLFGPVRSSPPQVAAFGRDGVLARYHFDGRVDELEIWRRGLSAEEIVLTRGPWIFGDGFESADLVAWSPLLP